MDRNSWGLWPGLSPHVTTVLFLSGVFDSGLPWAVAGALATWMAFRYANDRAAMAGITWTLVALSVILIVELAIGFLLFCMSPITVSASRIGQFSYRSDESHSFGVADLINDFMFATPLWAYLAGIVLEKWRLARPHSDTLSDSERQGSQSS